MTIMLLSICCALLLLLEVPCVAFQRPGEKVTWVKWDAVDDDQQDDDDDKLDHTADYEPVGEQFYYPPTMPINGEEGWQGYLPTVAGMKGRPHMVTAGKLKGFQTRRLSPHFQMWWKEIASGSAHAAGGLFCPSVVPGRWLACSVVNMKVSTCRA